MFSEGGREGAESRPPAGTRHGWRLVQLCAVLAFPSRHTLVVAVLRGERAEGRRRCEECEEARMRHQEQTAHVGRG